MLPVSPEPQFHSTCSQKNTNGLFEQIYKRPNIADIVTIIATIVNKQNS